jgi:hypothetical protein
MRCIRPPIGMGPTWGQFHEKHWSSSTSRRVGCRCVASLLTGSPAVSCTGSASARANTTATARANTTASSGSANTLSRCPGSDRRRRPSRSCGRLWRLLARETPPPQSRISQHLHLRKKAGLRAVPSSTSVEQQRCKRKPGAFLAQKPYRSGWRLLYSSRPPAYGPPRYAYLAGERI